MPPKKGAGGRDWESPLACKYTELHRYSGRLSVFALTVPCCAK